MNRSEKCGDWDTVGQVNQKPYAQPKQNKEFIQHFPRADRYSAVSRGARLHQAQQFLGKTNTNILNTLPFLLLPPSLYVEHNAEWYGISLGSVGVSGHSCVPSQLLAHPHPPQWWHEWGAAKALALCKHCSAETKTAVLSSCSQHKSKTQPCKSYCGENQLYPSKNQTKYYTSQQEQQWSQWAFYNYSNGICQQTKWPQQYLCQALQTFIIFSVRWQLIKVILSHSLTRCEVLYRCKIYATSWS